MHSSGALQFAPDVELTLKQLCGLKASKMLWRRMVLSNHSIEREFQYSYLSDNGPGYLSKLKEKTVK